MNWFQKLLGGPEQAANIVRNAGPGVAVPTKIKVYVGPARDMPLQQLLERRRRLAEVLPQYRDKEKSIFRKQRAHLVHALDGSQGKRAQDAANWMLEDVQKRAEERTAEIEQRIKIYDERIRTAAKDAGVVL